MRWIDALKKFNQGKIWCIPRQGTADYEAVKKIQREGASEPPKPAPDPPKSASKQPRISQETQKQLQNAIAYYNENPEFWKKASQKEKQGFYQQLTENFINVGDDKVPSWAKIGFKNWCSKGKRECIKPELEKTETELRELKSDLNMIYRGDLPKKYQGPKRSKQGIFNLQNTLRNKIDELENQVKTMRGGSTFSDMANQLLGQLGTASDVADKVPGLGQASKVLKGLDFANQIRQATGQVLANTADQFAPGASSNPIVKGLLGNFGMAKPKKRKGGMQSPQEDGPAQFSAQRPEGIQRVMALPGAFGLPQPKPVPAMPIPMPMQPGKHKLEDLSARPDPAKKPKGGRTEQPTPDPQVVSDVNRALQMLTGILNDPEYGQNHSEMINFPPGSPNLVHVLSVLIDRGGFGTIVKNALNEVLDSDAQMGNLGQVYTEVRRRFNRPDIQQAYTGRAKPRKELEKPKRAPTAYQIALKKWNEGKERWCFPNTRSPEYLEVLEIKKKLDEDKVAPVQKESAQVQPAVMRKPGKKEGLKLTKEERQLPPLIQVKLDKLKRVKRFYSENPNSWNETIPAMKKVFFGLIRDTKSTVPAYAKAEYEEWAKSN